MSLESTVKNEILELRTQLANLNDAVSYASKILNALRADATKSFEAVNSSQSYDDKIEILAGAIKESLVFQESSLLDLMSSTKSLKDKIEALETVVEKNSSIEESKKKDLEPGGTE